MNRNAEQKVQKNGEVVSKASVANPFDNSTNRHKKRTMIAILSLSLCFLLATTFGLQAVFRNKVDQGFDKNINIQSNILSKEVATFASKVMHQEFSDTILAKNSQDEQRRINELIEISDDFFDTIANDMETAWELLQNSLLPQEVEILAQVMQNIFEDQENVITPLSTKGYIKINIYVEYSPGWFFGNLSTVLFVAAITPIVLSIMGWGTSMAGPVGAIAGLIIGSTIGVLIERSVNNLINRDGKAGFRHDLIKETLLDAWWYIFKTNLEKNLLDFLFDLINFSGGNFMSSTSSTKPADLPPFTFA